MVSCSLKILNSNIINSTGIDVDTYKPDCKSLNYTYLGITKRIFNLSNP